MSMGIALNRVVIVITIQIVQQHKFLYALQKLVKNSRTNSNNSIKMLSTYICELLFQTMLTIK